MVEGALIGTTEFDIFSIDPSTCAENWRVHEEYPAYILPTNRGAAYLDGRLFRGTDDGRVLAYDFKTGKRLWETTIADVKTGEDVPAAPIAWEGLVFIGNAGGDFKGAKGHMYALDAKTGKIVWQFFLVPKTEGILFAGLRAPRRSTPRPGRTSRVLRSVVAEPGLLRRWTRLPGSCMCRLATPRPTSTTASARGTISSPAPSLSSTPRPALTRTISSLCPGIGTTGMSPTRRL
jgi:glucose dehydrogenase